MGSSGTASTDDSAADEMQRLADEAAYYDDEDDEDDEDGDTRVNHRPSYTHSRHKDIDIESIDIDIIFRHPAVRKLLDKLAEQDKKFEHISEEDLRKHPYVTQLLAHVFDLSCRVATLEQEIGMRDDEKKSGKATLSSSTANRASSSSARQTAPSSSSALVIQLRDKEGGTEIPLRKRRFYSRSSAVKAFKPKAPSAPSVIYKIHEDEPVSDERFAELKDAAEDHVEDLHRLPDITCGLKHKTIGYYNTYYESELVEAINKLAKDHPELQSRENWKGRTLIDYCLRGCRKRNPAYIPSSGRRSAAVPGLPAEDGDSLAENEDILAFSSASNASDPLIQPPSSLIVATAQPSPTPSPAISATNATRRSYAQPDYSALGRALGREIPNIPDISSSTVSTSIATAEPGPSPQPSPTNAPPSQQAPLTSMTTPSNLAHASQSASQTGPQDGSEQAANVVDINSIDRDVGRYLCQARDATFNMKSTRPSLKKALYGFSNSFPFSRAELDAAQAKAAINASTSSPQKRKQRATTAGSPSKRQATATRTPLRVIDNADAASSASQQETQQSAVGGPDPTN
ncbi:hypothetical protein OC842_006190 [Tilletia horrida]|uniref:Uncharacterized protein n=1 Tax=Tilletia horrida TaxID=155126 RepID=A0AAN6G7Q4_9BASI|nr:hypothetical protein OC842_006190 [Tilletia horrida]